MIRLLYTALLIIGFIPSVFAEQWTQLTDFGGAGRHRATGLVIGNKAYVGCGHINGTGIETLYDDWWEYDAASNAWTQKANLPWIKDSLNPNPYLTILDVTGVDINGEAYFNLGNWAPVLKYSPLTNTWTELSSSGYASTRYYNSKPLHIDGKGYFFARNPYKLAVYDPSLNQWSDHPTFSLPDSTAVSWSNVYSYDGIMYFTAWDGNENKFWSYNVINDTWSELGAWPPIWNENTIFRHQGVLVIVGGYYNHLYAYDPQAQIWTELQEFPGAIRRFGVGFTLNETGYMCTGTNGVNLKDLWRMNNILSTEELSADMEVNVYPNPAADHAVINSKSALEFSYNLFSPTGQLIRSGETNSGSLRIERNNLPSGNYTAVIKSSDSKAVTKKVLFR